MAYDSCDAKSHSSLRWLSLTLITSPVQKTDIGAVIVGGTPLGLVSQGIRMVGSTVQVQLSPLFSSSIKNNLDLITRTVATTT
jgi:hypothetical protein